VADDFESIRPDHVRTIRFSRSATSDDELHKAYCITQPSAMLKMFTHAMDSDDTVVSYHGNPIVEVKGDPKRYTKSTDIVRQLKEHRTAGYWSN
jgi:hypothetical protein